MKDELRKVLKKIVREIIQISDHNGQWQVCFAYPDWNGWGWMAGVLQPLDIGNSDGTFEIGTKRQAAAVAGVLRRRMLRLFDSILSGETESRRRWLGQKRRQWEKEDAAELEMRE
jgi:hypothetical protein